MPEPTDTPDILYTVGHHILGVIKECFDENGLGVTPSGEAIEYFVSHGRPAADCCNFVSIWFARLRPARTGDFPYSTDRFIRPCVGIKMMGEFMLTFRTDCVPIVSDNMNNPFPTPEELDASGRLLAKYGRIIFCCLISAFERHALTGILPDGDPELEPVVFDDLYPYGPQGGCAGWDQKITIELPDCC